MDIQVDRQSNFVLVSDEELAEGANQRLAFERWFAARDEQREIWAREAEEARRIERETAAAPAELTLDALLDKLDFTREYAEHLMQPYCTCDHGNDGWDHCQHARDLGFPKFD